MKQTTTVTLARGDGVGPEIADAVVAILEEAGASLDFETIETNERQHPTRHASGFTPYAWETIRKNPALLKAPAALPQGRTSEGSSAMIKSAANMFAHVRPLRSYIPAIPCAPPGMDLVLIRENAGLWAEDVAQQEATKKCGANVHLRSARIIRFAFDYALANNRERVTCVTRDDVTAYTDDRFSQMLHEIAAGYAGIEHDHHSMDTNAAPVTSSLEGWDVVVMPEHCDELFSRFASQVPDSLALTSSAHFGEHVSMFEANHGPALELAGRDLANPSGLLQAANQMLTYLGQHATAALIENAWRVPLEQGIHPANLYTPAYSTQRVGTRAFTRAIIERLGEEPRMLNPALPIPPRIISPAHSAHPHTSDKDQGELDSSSYWSGQHARI